VGGTRLDKASHLFRVDGGKQESEHEFEGEGRPIGLDGRPQATLRVLKVRMSRVTGNDLADEDTSWGEHGGRG